MGPLAALLGHVLGGWLVLTIGFSSGSFCRSWPHNYVNGGTQRDEVNAKWVVCV